MANIRLQAIKPKKLPIINLASARSGLDRELANFIGKVHADMADYPDQQPTTSGYIRSGDYGREWHEELTDSPREVRLVNRVASTRSRYQTKRHGIRERKHRKRKYASFVGGKKAGADDERQAREMGRRGWKRIDDVAAQHWPPSRRRIIRILGGDV